MALGRVREALSDCLTACTVDPEFEKVRLRAANCHLMLGEFDAARAWYAECAKAGSPGGGGVSIKVWAEVSLKVLSLLESRLDESLFCGWFNPSLGVQGNLDLYVEFESVTTWGRGLWCLQNEAHRPGVSTLLLFSTKKCSPLLFFFSMTAI